MFSVRGTLILLGSITYALKAKNILFNHNIRAYIERNTSNKTYGCGYGVFLPFNELRAEEILKNNGIKIVAKITKK